MVGTAVTRALRASRSVPISAELAVRHDLQAPDAFLERCLAAPGLRRGAWGVDPLVRRARPLQESGMLEAVARLAREWFRRRLRNREAAAEAAAAGIPLEFKAQTVRLAPESGKSTGVLAWELDLGESGLRLPA